MVVDALAVRPQVVLLHHLGLGVIEVVASEAGFRPVVVVLRLLEFYFLAFFVEVEARYLAWHLLGLILW